MSDSSNWQAVVVAGGVGRRFGRDIPKQFVDVLGVPLIWHTLAGILSAPFIGKAIVVVKDLQTFKAWLPDDGRLQFAPSGAERFDSVLSGLECLASDCPSEAWVAVHDAARPMVCQPMISRLREYLLQNTALDGVIAARPAVDTVKETVGSRIERTLDRQRLWLAETPQVFRFGELVAAMRASSKHARQQMTDEASVMEANGACIHCVDTMVRNEKLTQPADLELVEWRLRRQIEQGLRPHPKNFFGK